MNARSKGLAYVREVRKILEGLDHVVEGPGYGVAFFDGNMRPIHRDFFGVFDLISYSGIHFVFHQVSTLSNKAAKIKAIRELNMPGWVWVRVENPVGYRVFQIDRIGVVIEVDMEFVPKKIKEGKK